MLIEPSESTLIRMKKSSLKETDLFKNIEVIQIKSKCRERNILNHYFSNSKSHLCKGLGVEEDEDEDEGEGEREGKDNEEEEVVIESFQDEWKEENTNEIRTINDLETDVKTPSSNPLSTNNQFMVHTKQSHKTHSMLKTKETIKYNGNKVYQDITAYCCSGYNKLLLKEFLIRPLVQGKTLYCNIKHLSVKDADNNNNDYYYCFIQGNDFPLMKIKNVTKNRLQSLKYYVYYDRNILMGKIKGNFFSTWFDFFTMKKELKENQGNVQYKLNPFGIFGLRKMDIFLTHLDGQSIQYTNKKANWVQKYKEYRLDFNSRVKKASSKNFIIENNKKERLLQFGKIDEELYAMDFQAPLSPFQAFCLCATSIISKVLCE